MSHARTFVVGDIHGCVDEVDCLLDALAPATADTIVFLGDYIDRGPSSQAVIARMLRLRQEGPRCVFLKGNHEDMFLAYMGEAGAYGDAFLFNGGEATLRSYGLEGQQAGSIAARLPGDHLQFLRALEMRFQHGPFLCVHAGLAPHRPFDDQHDEDLLWIRDAFIAHPHSFGCTVLFGHTPHRDVLLDQPYKIGLDTGLVYWNKLSCLELAEQRLYQIHRGERAVTDRALPQPAVEAPRSSS